MKVVTSFCTTDYEMLETGNNNTTGSKLNIVPHHLQIGTNIPKYLEECSETPFVLIVGSQEDHIQTFVVIDGVGLEQPSLLKAVDVCFKLFYILDIHYPWQCSTTWEFIQKVLFGIEDKHKGKTSPAVVAMRAALK